MTMKRFLAPLLALLFTLVAGAAAARDFLDTQTLAGAVTSNSAQSAVQFSPGSKSFVATLSVTSGSGSATVTIQGSIDGTTFVDLGTMSPTNTTPDSITLVAPAYVYYRSVVSAISGTGAAVTVKGSN